MIDMSKVAAEAIAKDMINMACAVYKNSLLVVDKKEEEKKEMVKVTSDEIKTVECNHFEKRIVGEIAGVKECIRRSKYVIEREMKKQKKWEETITEMERPEVVTETKKKIETVLNEAASIGITITNKKSFYGDKSPWHTGNVMLATYSKGDVTIPLEGELIVSKKGEVSLIFIKERADSNGYYRFQRPRDAFVIFSFNYAKKLSVRNNVLRFLMKRD